MLCCITDGYKIPAFIAFKCKAKIKEKLPPKVIVRVNEKGFFSEETVLEWFCLISIWHPGGLLKPKSMVLD